MDGRTRPINANARAVLNSVLPPVLFGSPWRPFPSSLYAEEYLCEALIGFICVFTTSRRKAGVGSRAVADLFTDDASLRYAH